MEYNMPPIAGIDWEKAFHYLPTKDLLMEVLQEFVSSADNQTTKLSEFRDDVEREPGEAHFASFRIHAHAMKSSLRSIGSDLFEAAYELEVAGKEQRLDVILEKTDDFTIEYLSLAESLKVIVGEKKKESGFDEQAFFEEITIIRNTMNAFDIAGLQGAMKNIRDMEIPGVFADKVETLENAVRDLASDEVLKTCDTLEEMRTY
ncbi:MAG: hypothetical protein K5675_01715 [Lachnospiraceae bacterium]|nr:hypothetical protein [Lachnospiraceae bacterium]